VSLHQEVEHLLDLLGGLLLRSHRLHEGGVAHRRAGGVRPVDVVEDDPAAGLEEAIDEKKGEAVIGPGVGSIDITEIEPGIRIVLQHLHQSPGIRRLLVPDRYPISQAEA
jgi:hypothetical protein